MAFQSTFRMVRADDQLVLDITVEGMVTDVVTHVLRLADANVDGRIRLTFGPQQVMEYAANAAGVRFFQLRPIFTPPTSVVLAVPAGTPPVPATVAGLLALAHTLPLVTEPRAGTVDPIPARAVAARLPAIEAVAATRAALAGRDVDPGVLRRRDADRRRRQNAVTANPAPTARTGPRDSAAPSAAAIAEATAFALPYRLAIRPPGGATRLAHADHPIQHGDRVELWTSALEVRSGNGTVEAQLPVLFRAPKPVGTTTQQWKDVVKDDNLANSLKSVHCDFLAGQTDPLLRTPPEQGAVEPAALHRLRLSSLGAWLDLRGRWPAGNVKFLRHDTAMGRDQAQKIMVQGFLYPFRFKATSISETNRVIEKGSSRVAALHTTSTIVVTDPLVEFGTHKTQPQWPWRSVRMLSTTTLPGTLKDAKLGSTTPVTGAEILEVRGRPFAYECEAVDRAGETVRFSMPMIFVPQSEIDDDDLPALWRAQGADFTAVDLAGQPLAVAPLHDDDNAGALARADGAPLPTPAQATSVLARRMDFDIDGTGKALMTSVTGIVPALDAVLPGTEVTVGYAAKYVEAQFGAVNKGKVFLELVANQAGDLVKPVVGLAEKATGGLAAMNLSISGLSREFGAVSGAIGDIANGELNLASIIGTADKLLGIVPLRKLFPSPPGVDPKLPIKDAYRLVTDVLDGVATQDLTWQTPLFGGKDSQESVDLGGFARLQPLRPPDEPDAENRAMLRIFQHTEVNTATGAVHARSQTTVENVELQVIFDHEPVVTVPFKRITFTSTDGKKPDPDISMGAIRFGGLLGFVARLAELVDQHGFNDPPAVAVTDEEVVSTFSFQVPTIAIGMFALENVAFGAKLALHFNGDPLTLAFTFATPDNPFRLTVSALGGGGHLAIGFSTAGLVAIDGLLEFGASISLNLVVARASAEVMGGVAFSYRKIGLTETGGLTAFLRIHGELDVLSLISISVDLLLTLIYQFSGPDEGKLVGRAQLAVEVKIVFFSETVVVEVEQKFAGSNGDPTFAELMAPADFAGDLPWNVYCAAFTED